MYAFEILTLLELQEDEYHVQMISRAARNKPLHEKYQKAFNNLVDWGFIELIGDYWFPTAQAIEAIECFEKKFHDLSK